MKKAIPLILVSTVITLIFTAYLFVIIFPDCLFRYRSIHNNVTTLSAAPINSRLPSVLDSARTLLLRSPLYDSTISYRLYLCDNYHRFALFTGGRSSPFAITFPLVNRIFLAKTGLPEDVCFTNRPRNNRRSLHAVLTHEMTHGLLWKRFGLWRTRFGPQWKTEGYCEVVANESSFDPKTGIQLIKQGKKDRSSSFLYFKYRLYLMYLMKREHRSIEEIMHARFDTKMLDAAIRATADSLLPMPQ